MSNLYNSDVYMNDLRTTYLAIPGLNRLDGSSILITGATGMIGSYIVDTLVEYNKTIDNKITILAAGRDISKLKARFDGILNSNLIFLEYDLFGAVDNMHEPDYIIHAAGNSFPSAFREDPVGVVTGAVISTKNLLDYAMSYDSFKRFLYVSSGEVYSDIDTMNSRSCYPMGKKAAESVCSAYSAQFGIDTVVVRPCHTFGPNMHPSDNKATAQFFRDAIEGRDIILKSAGSQLRSYNYISDTVSGLLTVLIKGNKSEAYDLCSKDNVITIADLAKLIAEAYSKSVVFNTIDPKATSELSPISTQVLNSYYLETLGWTSQYSVINGINSTVRILSQ